MMTMTKRVSLALALAAALAAGKAQAVDVTITDFNNFSLDGLFANWGTATVNSNPTNYEIISSGYGSGFEDINPNINATGATHIELTVGLEGGAGPIGGPIVSLVDGDGTFLNYAWYGQEAGTHVLSLALASPTFTSSAGAVPGLDLSTLDFFHLQDDPGGYSGVYKITFENLRVYSIPEPATLGLAGCALAGLALRRRGR